MTLIAENTGVQDAVIGALDDTTLGFSNATNGLSYTGGSCANSTVSAGQTCTVDFNYSNTCAGAADMATLPYNDGAQPQIANAMIESLI
ncbi:MAG: hypothetical protein EOP05_17500 [Proteobacteria bacterium]|nr:MAG: hypothetical protein EOP05_17500 [Pseudomonadota bacterium]